MMQPIVPSYYHNKFSNGRNEWNMEFYWLFPLKTLKISPNHTKFLISRIFFLQIYISKKWGFTKWDREEYEGMRESGKFWIFPPNFRADCLQKFVYILGKLIQDGVNVKYMPDHGPLSAWCKVQAELAGL